MSEHPLPAVIGATENALRSLLAQVLASTHIHGYQEWVAVNLLSSAGAAAGPALTAAVGVGAAEKIIEELTTRGLVADRRLTPAGQEQLAQGRHAVAAATAPLVEGIGEAEQRATRTVLDTIRDRAERALLVRSPAAPVQM